jgi:hypothetical protein
MLDFCFIDCCFFDTFKVEDDYFFDVVDFFVLGWILVVESVAYSFLPFILVGDFYFTFSFDWLNLVEANFGPKTPLSDEWLSKFSLCCL